MGLRLGSMMGLVLMALNFCILLLDIWLVGLVRWLVSETEGC
jgi:hypothetical protein